MAESNSNRLELCGRILSNCKFVFPCEAISECRLLCKAICDSSLKRLEWTMVARPVADRKRAISGGPPGTAGRRLERFIACSLAAIAGSELFLFQRLSKSN